MGLGSSPKALPLGLSPPPVATQCDGRIGAPVSSIFPFYRPMTPGRVPCASHGRVIGTRPL